MIKFFRIRLHKSSIDIIKKIHTQGQLLFLFLFEKFASDFYLFIFCLFSEIRNLKFSKSREKLAVGGILKSDFSKRLKLLLSSAFNHRLDELRAGWGREMMNEMFQVTTITRFWMMIQIISSLKFCPWYGCL